MALSSSGSSGRPEPSPRGRRAATSRRAARSSDDRAPADDALRLAVETLSAEICWFFATDPLARGAVAGAATDLLPSRQPRS